jgi:hypothetical protein
MPLRDSSKAVIFASPARLDGFAGWRYILACWYVPFSHSHSTSRLEWLVSWIVIPDASLDDSDASLEGSAIHPWLLLSLVWTFPTHWTFLKIFWTSLMHPCPAPLLITSSSESFILLPLLHHHPGQPDEVPHSTVAGGRTSAAAAATVVQ